MEEKMVELNVGDCILEVHEKRDNPGAYGHYDVGLRITILPGYFGTQNMDDLDLKTKIESAYAYMAEFVKKKCDEWQANTLLEYEISERERRVNSDINGLVYCYDKDTLDSVVENIRAGIDGLPEDRRAPLEVRARAKIDEVSRGLEERHKF